MAAPADYLDTKDLKDVQAGGLVREDVLAKIFDISDIPTPFLDMVGEGSFSNSYSEWIDDQLAAPNLNNAVVSGSDINPVTTATGARVGNHAQISTKGVSVTERVQHTDNIGRSDEMGYQTARRLQELRRDVEAIALSTQASVADDNNATAGKSAGLSAWIKTNDSFGATGASGGFNNGTKLVDAPTSGTARAGTYTMIRDQIEAVYLLGGNPTTLMSVPQITKRFSSFLFTTPDAATPTANVSGTEPASQVSQGYIDVFRTDFGFTVKIVPNRLQQAYGGGAKADVFLIDPEHVQVAYLYGYKVEPLAKLGLSHRKVLSVDWMLKCLLERAHAVIRDLTPTAAWTA